MKKAHQMDTDSADPYGISMEGSVVRLKRVWKTLQRFSYKCLKCDLVVHHRSTFGQHIRVNAASKQITCESREPSEAGLNFYQRELFLTQGRRKLLCHTCGAAFTEKTTFLNHVEEAHGEILRDKYVCEFCPYSANAPRYLRLHYERKHPSTPRPRSHVCEMCGKAFFDKIVLEDHVNYVHLKKKEFRCPLCPKVFYRPQSFNKHKTSHAGKRPHVCNTCGQSFVFPYNLKVHKRLHTGEKPHKCKQCDAAFTQKNGLDLHMKKHQKKEGVSLTPGSKLSMGTEIAHPALATQSHSQMTVPGSVQDSVPGSVQDAVLGTRVQDDLSVATVVGGGAVGAVSSYPPPVSAPPPPPPSPHPPVSEPNFTVL